ncbi:MULTISPECIES: ribosome recycling factor [Psychrobacter]|uniref:ribosome recycling factor n=1 Tax=Psychrobacter TaxID=497 RepID=UPI00191B0F0A|nr:MULTISPECIES: ribosome recycling factor [Psychrobacter]MBU5617886.1 ribosome recycling factor [Psychrobacter sp. TAE2020]
MIKEIKQEGEARMQKTLEALESTFSKVRTGRAHPGMLSGIMVSYYGAATPLNQVASVNVEDSRTLLVQPFDRTMIQAVDKAIREADLGLNPMTADVIRVPMPSLTEETRRDMQKLARGEAENSRVSIRNVRRDMMNDIKELAKEKEISEDDEHRASDEIQKITDKYIETIDSRLSKKEIDLMAV